jgi:hypothetical protein
MEQSMIEYHNPKGMVATKPMPYDLGINVRGANQITIGLLANGFPDSVNFLEKIGQVIRKEEPGVSLAFYNKGNASIPASDKILGEIKSGCDAVISAYGH